MKKIIEFSIFSLILSTSLCAFSQGIFCEVPAGGLDSIHLCERATIDHQTSKLKFSNKGKFYVFWGYQRSYHTRSDVTFHTNSGDFTIKDAVGNDRPSKEFKTYINPTTLSVPQYNVRIGYYISERWAIELGTDHMKWVFDNTRDYEITGDYSRDVWIDGEKVPFSEAIERKNARFLKFEHSDGYNYPHVSAQYNFPIFVSQNQNWSLIGEFGGGLGLFVPKTLVTIADNETSEPRSIDNKFKVAGYGTHANGRLRLEYKNFFIQGSSRFVLGKIERAPFLGDEGYISHTPILSTQLIFGAGVKFQLFGKNK